MSIEARDISKSFASLRVLNGVDLAVGDGEVHALLGANGSGKSTLAKILCGVYQPDSGEITVGRNKLAAIATPFEANALGIAVVHQEAPLVDTLSVAECMAMFRGYPTTGVGRIRWKQVHDEAGALLDRFGIKISPRALAGSLAPAERALVALVIALDRVRSGLQLLILDEVTASLPEDEAQIYLDRVRTLAEEGISILMVTHRLRELRGLAKRLTILRDGRLVHQGQVGELSDDAVVAEMIGTREETKAHKAASVSGAVRRLWNASAVAGSAPVDGAAASPATGDAIRVENLAGYVLRDTSFTVARGEIVGIAGLVDSGISELPNILAGILHRQAGRITIGGRELPAGATPGEAIEAGLMLLPADRLRNGGIGTLSVAENVLLPQMNQFWHARAREGRLLDAVIRELDVRPPSKKALFGKLSGGNQQKVILGKWLMMRPTALILDDPTSGVDPGAREIIFSILRDAVKEGMGILLFSTEPEQLAGTCSRVLVLKDGAVATELSGSALTREAISQWCYA